MQYRLCVVVATLLACGSTNDTSEDGGPDAFGHKNFDAAAQDQSTPFGDGSPEAGPPQGCGNIDASGFTPTWQQSWVPPSAFGQNRCALNEIYAYLSGCLFSGFSDPNACAAALKAPNSLDCFQCLAPGTSSTGPLRSPKDACGQTPSFNIGGCLSNALGSSCASAWMTANECAEIACSECYFCGGGEDIPDYMHPCIAAGGNSSCDGVRSAATCALSSTSPVVKTCLSIDQPTPKYVDFMNLFCGDAPPSDAGTD